MGRFFLLYENLKDFASFAKKKFFFAGIYFCKLEAHSQKFLDAKISDIKVFGWNVDSLHVAPTGNSSQ